MKRNGHTARLRVRDIGGFTLVELLVVLAVLALLTSLLLPALSAARGRMRALKCASNLRTVGLDFQLFAEGLTPRGQGDSEQLGPNRFYIGDFLDRLYRIDEFWEGPAEAPNTMHVGQELVMCPAGPARLFRRAGYPCGSAAIYPAADVTLAANMRLYRAAVEFEGKWVLAPAAATQVRRSILQRPLVPLLMDGDGRGATERGLEPFYAAPPPPDGGPGPYADGRYWLPSRRHGAVNVVFVGGHVLSSVRPTDELWDWTYQVQVGQ